MPSVLVLGGFFCSGRVNAFPLFGSATPPSLASGGRVAALTAWNSYCGCDVLPCTFAGLAGCGFLLGCVLLVLQYLVAALHEQCRDSCLLAAGSAVCG